MKGATLCYPLREGEVLLGMKKERFGAGKWNGFGGKMREGETAAEAAARELLEESSLRVRPEELEKAAVVSFYFGERPIFECHAFFARRWEGEPEESDEMRPRWFSVASLPYEAMWVSDPFWLPRALSGETFTATCRFDDEGARVERFELTHTPAQEL